MTLKTIPFDAAEFIDGPEAEVAFLNAALETGDAHHIARAIGVLARARGMTAIAKETGLAREALYRSLSGEGDPKLSTVLGVLDAMNVRLGAEPAE